jgi:chemotaxis signal transduction protein
VIAAPTVDTRLAELRRVFDRERAAPLSTRTEEQVENLLAIRILKDSYALRVGEISGLAAGKNIVKLPSPIRELRGIAAVRGVLVPVYNLGALLGYSAEVDETRWLALCGSEDCIALAFSEFDGCLRIPRTQIFPAEQDQAARTHVTHVARGTDRVLAVVSVPLLKAAIQERCQSGAAKER